MRRLMLALAVSAIAIAPLAAAAAEQPILAQQKAPAPPRAEGLDSGKILAIGAGIIVGAAVASAALGFRGATVLGAVAGGVIASWWYGDRSDIATLEPRKTTP